MVALNKSIKLSLAFLCLLFMAAFDIWFDFKNGIQIRHLLFEGMVFFVSLIGFNFFLSKALKNQYKQTERIKSLEDSVNQKDTQLKTLNNKVQSYKEEFSNEIQQNFKSWKLTKAENQVASLLLKGLSLKEIAEVRSSNENTVRSQCTSVYKKSKLANRSQLSSYFLDDLI